MSQAREVEEGAFRLAMGRFVTGVGVVTTVADGHDHAMTANALTSVSLDPLLLLVCVEREARFHDAVLASPTFALSILAADQRPTAQWLATRGRPLHGQLDRIPFTRGAQSDCALLTGALAHLECRTTDVHLAGDHSLVVGEVVGIAIDDTTRPALTYYRGAYGSLD